MNVPEVLTADVSTGEKDRAFQSEFAGLFRTN
jgi:hypothetical protein